MAIEIHISADTAGEARRQMEELLGPKTLRVEWVDAGAIDSGKLLDKLNETDTAIRPCTPADVEPAATEAVTATTADPTDFPNTTSAEAKKRTRRTKAEMEAARTAETAPAEAPQISTGDERVGPEDDAETAAQDAADEAAEVEASRDPEKPLTKDDLRSAVGDYMNAYPKDTANADLFAIFEQALGPVPAGTTNKDGRVVDKWMLSAIPEDQATLAKAVAAVADAVKNNPFKRERV